MVGFGGGVGFGQLQDQDIPEKCTIYSKIMGLIKAKNYNFGGKFVYHTVKAFKENLRQC